MKSNLIISALILFSSLTLTAQEETALPDTIRKDALNLYMRVSDHVRREIPYVNYVRDIKEADVYVISTSQTTGAGGREYTYFFYGQRKFSGMADTLKFSSSPDDTHDVVRTKEIQTLQMGLMRYVARTPLSQFMELRFNQPVEQTIH